MATMKHGIEFQRYVVVAGTRYSVTRPLNNWDMNFHFIDDAGDDHLADLQDVLDFTGKRGANIDDAIRFVTDYLAQSFNPFWRVI